MSLSKELFTDRSNKRVVPFIDVDVPEYTEDGAPEVESLRVQQLGADEVGMVNEIDALRREMKQGGATAKYSTYEKHMVGLSLVDPLTGVKFFTDLTQVKNGLAKMPNPVVMRLFDACAKLNRRDQKSIDELVGNLEETQESDSGSSLPDEPESP
tara:strand:+ start:1696 stop:2160 length:465 start_codon:yes stop_codon:yes gene_type:complete